VAPAFVITAEYDPLRDEGEAYAARLREEGVQVVLRRYDGVTHGFFGMPAQLDKAKAAIAEAGSALRVTVGG
jgi:acetyl esterase